MGDVPVRADRPDGAGRAAQPVDFDAATAFVTEDDIRGGFLDFFAARLAGALG